MRTRKRRWRKIASSIDQYHRYRKELLRDILLSHGWKTPLLDLLFCENCFKMEEDVEELHVHHPNENGDVSGVGGWQALYSHKEDFENGVELRIYCKGCHLAEHREETLIPVPEEEA